MDNNEVCISCSLGNNECQVYLAALKVIKELFKIVKNDYIDIDPDKMITFIDNMMELAKK